MEEKSSAVRFGHRENQLRMSYEPIEQMMKESVLNSATESSCHHNPFVYLAKHLYNVAGNATMNKMIVTSRRVISQNSAERDVKDTRVNSLRRSLKVGSAIPFASAKGRARERKGDIQVGGWGWERERARAIHGLTEIYNVMVDTQEEVTGIQNQSTEEERFCGGVLYHTTVLE